MPMASGKLVEQDASSVIRVERWLRVAPAVGLNFQLRVIVATLHGLRKHLDGTRLQPNKWYCFACSAPYGWVTKNDVQVARGWVCGERKITSCTAIEEWPAVLASSRDVTDFLSAAASFQCYSEFPGWTLVLVFVLYGRTLIIL